MQPLQYDLPCPGAKDNTITHAAAAPSNLDATITAQTELQKTIEIRTATSEIATPKPDPGTKAKKDDFEALLKQTWKENRTRQNCPKLRKSADKSLSQPWCSHSKTISCIRQLSNTHSVRDFLQRVKVEDVKTKLPCETSFKIWKWKKWKRSCRWRLPSESESGRWENETVVRGFPQKSDTGRCGNETVVGDFSQRVKVEDVKTNLSCETSLKTESERCEHAVFMRDFLQILKVQIVKMKPELAVPMRGRSDHDPRIAGTVSHPSARQASPHIFRDRFCLAKHSISFIYYLSNAHFVRDFPQKVKVEDVKTKLSCETSFKIRKWKICCRGRLPSESESGRCENENEALVRDFPQKVKVEDERTKLSCEASLKKWHWKMWKRSFRARLPSKSESVRCENEAFVRDFLQNLKVKDVNTKFSCETSFKFWKCKLWKWSLNSQFQCGADPTMIRA